MPSEPIPTFAEVFALLVARGPAGVVSSIGTNYTVTAKIPRDGVKTIIAKPRSSEVRIHEDCWGAALTCKRTRAGGIYNGSPSIFDWYLQHRPWSR